MCGSAGAPQNIADAEVNCIYADIQNSVIRTIFGKKKKKRGGNKSKTRKFNRLTCREGEKGK